MISENNEPVEGGGKKKVIVRRIVRRKKEKGDIGSDQTSTFSQSPSLKKRRVRRKKKSVDENEIDNDESTNVSDPIHEEKKKKKRRIRKKVSVDSESIGGISTVSKRKVRRKKIKKEEVNYGENGVVEKEKKRRKRIVRRVVKKKNRRISSFEDDEIGGQVESPPNNTLLLPNNSYPSSSRSSFKGNISISNRNTYKNNHKSNTHFNVSKISNINEHYELNQLVQNDLVSLQHHLSKEIINIRGDLQSLQMKRDYILKETTDMFHEICKRLNSEFSNKQSKLQSMHDSNTSRIEKIESFIHKAQMSNNTSFTPKELISEGHLLLAKEENENISRRIDPSKIDSDEEFIDSQNNNELRRELFELRTIERKYEEMKKMIGIKDDVIKQLVLENKQIQIIRDEEVKKVSQLYLKTKEELYRWISIAKRRKKRGSGERNGGGKSFDHDILLRRHSIETSKLVSDLTSSILKHRM